MGATDGLPTGLAGSAGRMAPACSLAGPRRSDGMDLDVPTPVHSDVLAGDLPGIIGGQE